VREALRDSLAKQPDIKVVVRPTSGNGVRARTQPGADVVVLDDSLPDMNSIEAAAKLKDARVNAKIVALSVHAIAVRYRDLRAGASAM